MVNNSNLRQFTQISPVNVTTESSMYNPLYPEECESRQQTDFVMDVVNMDQVFWRCWDIRLLVTEEQLLQYRL